MNAVVEVTELSKRYGALTAVDGVSFQVEEGNIFGLLGPNGAGKTTTTECIEGLREPTGGTIKVLGLDPQSQGRELRERIGVQFQASHLPSRIKVWEALDLFASFYQQAVEWEELLEQLGLAEKRDESVAKLSGGQKQRVYAALALVNDPEVVFLDELTTGLDPQARHNIWDLIEEIRDRGTTVFLTTHFMDEAERLCDWVAILDHGKILALDTPQGLIQSLEAGARVIFETNSELSPTVLEALPSVTRVDVNGKRVTVHGREQGLVSGVVRTLESQEIAYENLRTEQPDLEDVFLALTGREFRS